MKKILSFYLEKLNNVLNAREKHNYKENKIHLVIFFAITFFIMATIFATLYPGDLLSFNINYFSASIITIITVSYVNAKIITEEFYQRRNNLKYSIIPVEIGKIFEILGILFMIVNLVYRDIYYDIVGDVDILIFSILAYTFLILRTLTVIFVDKGTDSLSRVLFAIIFIPLFMKLYFYTTPLLSIKYTTISSVLIIIVLYMIQYLLKGIKFFDSGPYFVLKVILVMVGVFLAYSSKYAFADLIGTKPNVEEIISLDETTYNEFYKIKIHDNKIYTLLNESQVHSEGYIKVFHMDGSLITEFVLPSGSNDFIIFENQIRVVNEDSENKVSQYYLNDNYELVLEDFRDTICTAPEHVLEIDTSLSAYVVEGCYTPNDSGIVYRDNEHIIYYDENNLYQLTDETDSNDYIYFVNHFPVDVGFTNDSNRIENTYEMYHYSDVVIMLNERTVISGEPIVVLNTNNSAYNVINDNRDSRIHSFYYTDDKYIVIENSLFGLYNQSIVVYDKLGEPINYLVMETPYYTEDDGYLYIRSHSTESNVIKIDLDDISEFVVSKRYNQEDEKSSEYWIQNYGLGDYLEYEPNFQQMTGVLEALLMAICIAIPGLNKKLVIESNKTKGTTEK